MEACDALVALDGYADLVEFLYLLYRKVVADGPRAVPNEVMYRPERRRVANDDVEQVVDCALQHRGWP